MVFEHTAWVPAPPEAVFALTQDYGRRLSWDPFLKSAALVGGATAPAVGVRAWCVASWGLGMETEYVAFTAPRIAAVRMTRGPWLLPRFLAWGIEPLVRAWFSRETRRRVEALRAALDAKPR
jgi:hypothetical protein